MKKLLLIILLLNFLNDTIAQCYYHDQSNPPEELFRKRVKEDKMRYGNPYTMFVRGDDFDVKVEIKKIKDNIRNGTPISKDSLPIYARLYAAIYNYAANESEPDRCPELEESQTCIHPAWVKNNAIVYLIGLKYSVVGGKGQFDSLTPTEKQEFFEKAKQGLRNLNPNVNTCNWGMEYKPEWYTLGTSVRCGKVRIKAAELTLYLQAYDLLKASYEIKTELRDKGRNPWGFGDADRNGLDCSQRNKLRRATRELYTYSEGWLSITDHKYGWKKNHGIAAASAVLMAAQVLNDAGVETNYLNGIFGWLWGDGFVWPHPKYSPVKTII